MNFHSHTHFQTAVGTSINNKRKWWQAQSQSDACQTKHRTDDAKTKKTKKTARTTFVDALRKKAKLFSGADIDNKDDWTHLRHCKARNCQTCTFLSMVVKWAPLLKYKNEDGKASSWLGRQLNKKGDVLVGCKACKTVIASNPNWTCPWSSFSIEVSKLRLTSVRVHSECKKHILALNTIATQASGGSSSSSSSTSGASMSRSVIVAAPSIEVFSSVWETAGGKQAKIKRNPSNKIMWCISEVLKARTRKFLETADCIGLIRDERKGRLLIRYRAVKGLDLQCGVLGQAKDFGTGHENIGEATVNILKQALTPKTGAPKSAVSSKKKAELSRRLAERTAEVLKKVEMLCVDSASDELLSGQVMRYGSENIADYNNGVTPNLKLVIRDATHAARRCSQKPEAADEFLTTLVRTLFSSKDSVTQRIHNSHQWTQAFKEYADDIDAKIGPKVSNLKAAKHRHESFNKPKCRFVLYLDAFITVATHMVRKGGDYKRFGTMFLDYINEEVAVQAAMLADASCEGLQFVRKMDDEETDLSEVNSALGEYLLRLETLFVQEQCVHVTGYTQFMLERLETPCTWKHRGQLKVLGGAGSTWDKPGVIKRCLQRMRGYTKIAMHVSKAEFPDFEVCMCFEVFGREMVKHSASTPDVTQLSEEAKKQLRRLATFYNVSEACLLNQYAEFVPFAKQQLLRCEETKKMGDVWITVLKNRLAPESAFCHVIRRFLLYTASTARVEQNFSALKRVFNDQRLRMSSDKESRFAKLVLEHMSDDAPSKQQILKEAQQIYVLHFSVHRGGYTTRVDKGVLKPTDMVGNTEAAWIRRRERSVADAVSQFRDGSSSVQAVQSRLESVDIGDAWTDNHDEMVSKQSQKVERRMIDAMLDHGDVCGHTTEQLEQQVEAEREGRVKRAREKQNHAIAINAVVSRKTHTLQGATFFFEESTIDLHKAVARHDGCSVVDDRLLASHFVVKDLRSPGMRVNWCAKLMGGNILPPSTLLKGKGPLIAFKPAYLTRRLIWVTSDFKERHQTAFEILKKAIEHPSSKWRLLETEADFREHFVRLANRPAELCVLKCTTETFVPNLPDNARCYDASTFLKTFNKYDEAVSQIGAANR